MRGDLLRVTLLLLLLVVSVRPSPAPELQAFARIQRLLRGLLGLGQAEEKVDLTDDLSQAGAEQGYQVLQSFEVREFYSNLSY